MVINCNVPNLNGLDEETKLKRIEKYLWELDDQLRFILSNLEIDNFTLETQEALQVGENAKKKTEEHMQQVVESMKQKIVNTATSIRSDLETIRETMEGHYEAISAQFGTYTADYFRETTRNALNDIDVFKQIEKINSNYVTSQGYVKTGKLGDETYVDENGETRSRVVYGIEIGDVQDESGTKLRSSNRRISFIEDGIETGYVEGRQIKINRLIVGEYIYLGGYRVEVTNGVEWKWEGYDG